MHCNYYKYSVRLHKLVHIKYTTGVKEEQIYLTRVFMYTTVEVNSNFDCFILKTFVYKFLQVQLF